MLILMFLVHHVAAEGAAVVTYLAVRWLLIQELQFRWQQKHRRTGIRMERWYEIQRRSR